MPESSSRLPYVEKAKTAILEILKEVEVAYDRELRYRLESRFAHDITWRALAELKSEDRVKDFGLPGRKKKEGEEEVVPGRFYALPELWSEKRRELEKKAREKRHLVALGVAALSEAGRHAEELFWRALREVAEGEGWEVFPERAEEVGREVPKKLLERKWGWIEEALGVGPEVAREAWELAERNREVENWKKSVLMGGDFDMALRVGEGAVFAVEIKNGLAYPKLYGKILAMSKLGLLPLLVVRWLSLGQVRVLPGPDRGAPYGSIIFRRAIFPQTYGDLAARLSEEVGWPVEARDRVDPDWLGERVRAAVGGVLDHRDEVVRFQDEILSLEFEVGRLRAALDSGRP